MLNEYAKKKKKKKKKYKKFFTEKSYNKVGKWYRIGKVRAR